MSLMLNSWTVFVSEIVRGPCKQVFRTLCKPNFHQMLYLQVPLLCPLLFRLHKNSINNIIIALVVVFTSFTQGCSDTGGK